MWTCIRQKLKSLRLGKGWTQAELATRLGVGTGHIGNWEAGLRTIPTELLPALSDVLDFDFAGVWIPPTLHLPGDNRRVLMPPYPIQGSVEEFPRMGYRRPTVPRIVLSEMETGYPRDTVHELIAAFKVLGDGGSLCFTSLDALDCPYLVTTGEKHNPNGLRHLRHALRWQDSILIPQVTLASILQARTRRVDWLVLCQKQWLYVELNGGRHDPHVDDLRAAGLSLPELRYSNDTVLDERFIRWLGKDIERTKTKRCYNR